MSKRVYPRGAPYDLLATRHSDSGLVGGRESRDSILSVDSASEGNAHEVQVHVRV